MIAFAKTSTEYKLPSLNLVLRGRGGNNVPLAAARRMTKCGDTDPKRIIIVYKGNNASRIFKKVESSNIFAVLPEAVN